MGKVVGLYKIETQNPWRVNTLVCWLLGVKGAPDDAVNELVYLLSFGLI